MRVKVILPLLITVLGCTILLVEPQRGTSAPQKGMKGKMDPGDMFDKWMSKGRGYFLVEEARFGKEELQTFAKDNGISDGKISRDQFIKYWARREEMREKKDDPSKKVEVVKKEEPKRSGPDNADVDARATETFTRYDTNGDGYLNAEEIGKTNRFRNEWEKWDANGDKLISLAEWRTYFRDMNQRKIAQREERDAERAKTDTAKKSSASSPAKGVIIIEEDDDAPPLVYHAGAKLPAGVPAWFTELDKDKDGQVSLYEWNKGKEGKDLDVFERMDRNGDGYLTVEEVLYFQRFVENGGTARPDQVATIVPGQKTRDTPREEGMNKKGKFKKMKGP